MWFLKGILTIAHNVIGYLYYTGISCGWVWGFAPSNSYSNRITKNHIHHLGDGLFSDMGGIYLFAFSKEEPLNVTSGEQKFSILYDTNIIYTTGTKMYALPRNTVKWKTFNLMKNLFWSITTDTPTMYEVDGKTYRFVEFTALGFDTGSMVADPMFADAEHYDFTLAPDSPAFKLGFRAIDTSDVGPRR